MEDFIKERNEALLSLDRERILAYGKKYNVKFPEDEKIFWAGVHKAICSLYLIPVNKITKSQYEKSKEWLKENGFEWQLK